MGGNYTYIIASLPALTTEYKPSHKDGCNGLIDWILSQLDGKDADKARLVREGFNPGSLDGDFYRKAFASGNDFIRAFFTRDLNIRNAKVEYLNKALERPAGTDVLQIEGVPEDNGQQAVAAIFKGDDLLERERAIDNSLWAVCDEVTLFKYFTLDNVLAIVAKLCIINRWLSLDEEAGRQMLRRLIEGVRGSYGNIEFEKFE